MSTSILDGRAIVITGGAGFVGSRLAAELRRQLPGQPLVAFDNLKRRGSFLNLEFLAERDIGMIHGDIRCDEDLRQLPNFCLLIDCSAEASVHAAKENVKYVLNTNLVGTMHLLEVAHARQAAFLLLSTSRVYPIEAVNRLAFAETETRFTWVDQDHPGFSLRGLAEQFPLDGSRSFYGSSKLCCELLAQEYVAECGLRSLTNRCGILAGPGQMGVASQGIVAFWVLSHRFRRPLRYIGFDGHGKQVRDVLHVDDLADLVVQQIARPDVWDGRVYNVGGGTAVSTSLRELTDVCQQVTGNRVTIDSVPTTSDLDVRILMLDSAEASADFDWSPRRMLPQIVDDIHRWAAENEQSLRRTL